MTITYGYLSLSNLNLQLPPDAILNLVRTASKTGCEVVIGGLDWIERGNHRLLSNVQSVPLYGNETILDYITSNPVLLIGCNKLILRSFFISEKLFFYPKILHEDLLWSFMLFFISQIIVIKLSTFISENDFVEIDSDLIK